MNTYPEADVDVRTATILRGNTWGFAFLTFALLLDVMYRGLVFREACWDLLALIIISGFIPVVYAAQHKVPILNRKFLASLLVTGLVAAVVAALVAALVAR